MKSLWLLIIVGLFGLLVSNTPNVNAAPKADIPLVVSTPVSTLLTEEPTKLPTVASTVISTLPTKKPTNTPSATAQPTNVAFVDTRNPSDWKNWSAIPDSIDPALKELYWQGVAKGNDPHILLVAGDCQAVPNFLFGAFDVLGSYNLAEQSNLQPTIDWFRGSWSWFSPSVHGGQTIVGVQVKNPLLRFDNNNSGLCSASESFFECGVRIRKPSILLITFEQKTPTLDMYELYLSKMIDTALGQGIIPVVGTSADNQDINALIAKVAVEKHVPVWNFWPTVQSLPKKGLDSALSDGFHLSIWDRFNFSTQNPSGWTKRNETGLQAISAVWQMLAK